MASLKEIKGRIASVKNTLKITSAMKLVASAKLHKAQMAIDGMLPYNNRLTGIINNLLRSEQTGETFVSPLLEKREVKRVALVMVSSSASLCGGFNNNLIRFIQQVIDEYQALLQKEGSIVLFPIGRKVAQAISALAHTQVVDDYLLIGEKPTYAQASELAARLTDLFLRGEIDRVELIYTHYKNMAVQVLRRESFLPVDVDAIDNQQFVDGKQAASSDTDASVNNPNDNFSTGVLSTDYLFEPSVGELLTSLLPQALAVRLFAMLLDSAAAEHAARTFAMQQATDNADGLLQELNLMYNKNRQQAITNELLDIVGGQMK